MEEILGKWRTTIGVCGETVAEAEESKVRLLHDLYYHYPSSRSQVMVVS